MKRGIAVALLHIAIVLSLAAKYSWDREHLPRAWALTRNYDPNLPLRGRYVHLTVVLDLPPPPRESFPYHANLSVRDGRLHAQWAETGGRGVYRWEPDFVLQDGIAFFLPEHAPDPTVLKPGEQLWVELTVPPKGAPRPVRLGVMRNGSISPLEFK